MKWFLLKRNTKKINKQTESATVEWEPACSPVEILAQPVYQENLHELKQLVSVTPYYFQEFYQKLLQNIAGIVQKLPHPLYPRYNLKYGFLLAILDYMVVALKIRRGYMLPIGADTETCYREQDVWTYAIFTAALLQECWLLLSAFQIEIDTSTTDDVHLWNPLLTPTIAPNSFYKFKTIGVISFWQSANPLLTKSLVPDKAFTWLAHYPGVFKYWWKIIVGIADANNPIQEILQKAHHHLFSNEIKSEASTNDWNIQNEDIAISTAQNELATEFSEKIKTENNAETEILTEEIPKKSEVTIAHQVSVLTDILITTLKLHLKQKQLEINQPQGFIHRIHEGILLIIPAFWEWLILHCPELKNKLNAHPNENNYSSILETLFEENKLIKNSTKNSLLHRYFIGRWEARQVLAGIVVPVESLFFPDQLPAINEELHLEPTL